MSDKPLVTFEQLTDAEKAFMWRIWERPSEGIGWLENNEIEAVKNLLNFGLIYAGLTQRYAFSMVGREMMIAEKLRQRKEAKE